MLRFNRRQKTKGDEFTNSLNSLFKDTDELYSRIKSYFKSCEAVPTLDEESCPVYDKNGAAVYSVPEKPPTVSGLALALGFNSRAELISFSGSKMQRKIIRRALSFIEEYAEAKLFDKGQYSGAKFFLANNFKGWSDKASSDDEETFAKLDNILSGICKIMREK